MVFLAASTGLRRGELIALRAGRRFRDECRQRHAVHLAECRGQYQDGGLPEASPATTCRRGGVEEVEDRVDRPGQTPIYCEVA